MDSAMRPFWCLPLSHRRITLCRRARAASLSRLAAAVEPLEPRVLLTSVVVNTTADVTHAAGSTVVSLRDAIAIANKSTTATTITFSPTVFATAKTITLNGSYLEVSAKEPVTLTGPAAGVTINGNQANLDLVIDNGVTSTISGATVTGGENGYGDGGAIVNAGSLTLKNTTVTGNDDPTNAGAIANYGTLVITNSTVSNNNARLDGGGIENETGAVLTLTNDTISGNTAGYSGGLENLGTATITGVTVSGNQAEGFTDPGGHSPGDNGGIGNYGKMTLTDSTVSGNTDGTTGGGIGNFGSLTLADCTVSGNTTGGGSFDNFGNGATYPAGGAGGGLYVKSTSPTVIQNTIIAGNQVISGTGPDVSGAVHSSGYNLIGQTDASTGWKAADLTGTSAHPLDALLSTLGAFGGVTQTIVPLSGSPAIDHGSNALVPAGVTTDQRGLPRIVNGTVDIGAVEVQPSAAHIVVTAKTGFTAVEGKLASLALGSFTESGATGPYVVDVNWGDGTPVDALAVAAPGALPADSHTFAKVGTYHGTITVLDATGRNSSPAPFTVTVGDAALSGSASPRSGIAAGVPFAIEAAKFSDADPNGTVAYYTAQINWGDGTTSAGVVASTTLGSTDGPFDVTGAHTYAKAGKYTFTVTVKDAGGSSLTVSSTITCVNATVIVVNTANDQTDPPGSKTVSLRDAVALADKTTVPTTITFSPSVFATAKTITLTGSDLELSSRTTIDIVGPAAGVTINGNNKTGVFVVNAGVSAVFSAVTIANGYVRTDSNDNALNGAGINNSGILLMTDCSVVNSNAFEGDGGGICNDGYAVLTGVTVSGNQAGGDAAGIENAGKLVLVNCTVSGNGNGTDPNTGGLYNGGDLSLFDCTVADNTGIDIGGISNSGLLTVANSIISGNTASNSQGAGYLAPDIAEQGLGVVLPATVDSLGSNLIGDASESTGWTSTDRTGSDAHPLNALLSSLGPFGGLTQTQVPLAGSPAIDHGSNALVPAGVTTDQRGLPRIANGTVDIGAVEVQPSTAHIVVTARTGMTAVEGQAASLAPASFTAPGATAPYVIEVNWGDGSPVDVYTASAPGVVPAHSHTFAEEGTYHGTVTVFDSTGHNSPATPFTVSVADAPLSGSAKGRSGIGAGIPFAVQAAQFTDADPNGTVTDYIAQINWGDGTSSTGMVASTTVGASTGPFSVTGTHTYAKTGTYTFTVTVKDAGGAALTVSSTLVCVTANVIVVNTVNDQTDPSGSKTVSLRDAVALADKSAVPATITFDPTIFATARTISLAGSELELSGKTTINIVGPSAGVTVSGNSRSRVFAIDAGESASFFGMTIVAGNTGAIMSGNADGGGILNQGTLLMTDCSVENSQSGNGYGGGIANDGGFLALNADTLSANSASDGGGIANDNGTAILINCTVANNLQVGDQGFSGAGGIENIGGTLTVKDSTISGNSTQNGLATGGINNAGQAIVANSIIANNTDPDETNPDVYGTFDSLGYNFVGMVFQSDGWVAADITGSQSLLDPDLSALGFNGGPTETFLPLKGSPVINKGSNALVPQGVTTDQRGLPRIVGGTVGGTVDIGAVEV